MVDLNITVDGSKLKTARQKLRPKLSHEAVGKLVGVSRQAIAKIEETGNTSSDLLAKLLLLYGIEIRDVTSREPANHT